jgi:hypothetical protein
MSATWKFANPQLIRDTTQAYPNKVTQFYSFSIELYPEYPETLTSNSNIFNPTESPASLINHDYLNDMYSAFLKTHGSRFAKPYTPAHLIKVTQHTYNLLNDINHDDEYIFTLIPSKINIIANIFKIIWTVNAQEIKIDFNDSEDEESIRDPLGVAGDLEEVDVSINVESGTDDDFLRLNSTEHDRDAQNVLKARLKARLARYKAEKAMARYISKYGKIDDDLIDSDESDDSDTESDD